MKLLYVASRFPHPPLRGDQVRAWHQLQRLCRRHTVTLIADVRGAAKADREAVRGLGLDLVAAPVWSGSQAVSLARGFGAGLPLQTAVFATTGWRRCVGRVLERGRHDLVHVQLARMEPVVPQRPGLPVLVDLIDALSLNMQRRSERDRSMIGRIAALDAPRLLQLERAICQRREVVTVVGAADREAIGPFNNLHLNPNGVDLETFRPRGAREAGRVVFAGNLGYYPNVEAALWLLEAIWPKVLALAPQTRLALAGARPARAVVRAAAKLPSVEVTGPVADLAAEVARSTVAVAPLRSGSGQALKVLEALACGTPVVATPLAVAGLPPGRSEAVVAASADEFAAAIARFLSDPGHAERVALSGRTLAAEYGWDRSVAQLEGLYDLARRASSASA